MPSSKPTFVIIPGAWHGPEAFDAPSAILKKKGYGIKYVHLASVGAKTPLKDFAPDVERVKNAVEEVLAAGKDVVLVMHSYGGLPGSEAMKYFMDEKTGANGRGKIVRMVWICAFVAPKGATLHAGIGGADLPWFKREDDLLVYPINAHEIFYNDLPNDVATSYASKLRSHSYQTFHSPLTVEPFRQIPSAYLVCEKDNAIPVQAQDGMVAQAKAIAPTSFDLVERLDASHSPFLSQPEKVAEFLERTAD